ncbi:MAG: urate hydroxylase PuuD [Bacteroidetes bacterium]|nr:urate hydroxylase PuuD [Bacteroidota bacterium]
MQFVDYLSILSRWTHIAAGILWIGLLYFFNFVNGPFAGTMDGDTKKKVVPELMPRALYWFRWGAAYTWITGVLLIYFVFESGNVFLANTSGGSAGSIVVLWSFILAPFIYDALAKSPLAKNPKVFTAIMFVLVVAVLWVMETVCGFGYRGMVIYMGAMFGTTMAYNVWYRIWPSQQKIINGVKTGNPADASVVALAGSRSKHNTYMSVPLVWAMINSHHAPMASNCDWGITSIFILVGWAAVMLVYKKAAKIKGF